MKTFVRSAILFSLLIANAIAEMGAASQSNSSSNTKNQPPNVSLLFPPPCCVMFPDSGGTRIRARAEDSDGLIVGVKFYADRQFIGMATNPPYTLLSGPPIPRPEGKTDWTLTAVAFDNLGLTATSAPAQVYFVQPPITTPGYFITAPTNEVTFAAPATFEFTAQLGISDGIDNPVDFYVGTNLVGTVADPPYTLTVTNVPEGRYELIVKSLGGHYHLPSYCEPITINVGKFNNSPPSVRMLPPIGEQAGHAFYAPATIRLTTEASDTDGTITQVEFFDGTNSIAVIREPPYSFIWSNVVSYGEYREITASATDNLGKTISSRVSFPFLRQPIPNAPFVRLTSPYDGGVYPPKAPMLVEVEILQNDNNVNPVELYFGTNLLARAYGPPWTTTISNLAAGTYTFSAKTTDLRGKESKLSVSTITVTEPRMVSPSLTSGGLFQFDLIGLPTRSSLTIETSTNLYDWADFAYGSTRTNNIFHFIDEISTNYFQRFYRVRVGPY